MEIDKLLISFLRGEGILCHATPTITIAYSADLDSGIPLTWPLARVNLEGLGDPDAIVKDWRFFCEAGDFAVGGKQHAFAYTWGTYKVRERLVERFRPQTRDDVGWESELLEGFRAAWERALNKLVDYFLGA